MSTTSKQQRKKDKKNLEKIGNVDVELYSVVGLGINCSQHRSKDVGLFGSKIGIFPATPEVDILSIVESTKKKKKKGNKKN
jgi:hypothetical protein